MPEYGIADLLADAYTPLLAFACLWQAVRHGAVTRRRFLQTITSNLALAWGWMLADRWLLFWPQWGLDYSSHTAVALALALPLSFAAPRRTLLWLASLSGYALLMVALQYHGIADIVSTALAAGIPMLAVCIRLQRAGPEMRASP